MSWGYCGWRPYVPVGERRARAAREMTKLAKKTGLRACPVLLEGRKIAATFWRKAWCDNLEAYSDFANRRHRYLQQLRQAHLSVQPGSAGASTKTLKNWVRKRGPELRPHSERDGNEQKKREAPNDSPCQARQGAEPTRSGSPQKLLQTLPARFNGGPDDNWVNGAQTKRSSLFTL